MTETENNQANKKLTETDIMNLIRVALAPHCDVFRVNVGLCFTKDGRPMRTGVPVGFSDLFGHRKSDGRAFYIEVKTGTGRPSENQTRFLNQMRKDGAIAGICRSPDDALRLLEVIP